MSNNQQPILVMSINQLKDFEDKCLKNVRYKDAKKIIQYIQQFIVKPKEETKDQANEELREVADPFEN
jgi:hypothetical protein